MTIRYEKDGTFSLVTSEGNLEGLTQIVLGAFEEKLLIRERERPDLPTERQRALAREDLLAEVSGLVARVNETCRRALAAVPSGTGRVDLVGRILMRPLEPAMETGGFPRHLIAPVLSALRHIIGEDSYEKLNEYSARPNLELCVVHELAGPQFDWDAFYQRNLRNIIWKRCHNALTRWIAEREAGVTALVDLINARFEEDAGRAFTAEDWRLLEESWRTGR